MNMKKQCGGFAEILLEDIMEGGRDDVIHFWESLYVLQNEDEAHPNLLSVLGELSQGGCTLEQILLDRDGHSLPPLKDVCETHKEYLLQKTKDLQEKQPPGTNMDKQSYSITERFVDLMVASGQAIKRSTVELEKMGGVQEYYLQKRQGGLERISSNRLFRWCHRFGRVPRTVLVSGVPGIGKTTLMQKFVFDWVIGKLYQRFAFVFFFKFRELNELSEISLEELICKGYPHLEMHLRTILKSPENLLFIFDGLDESKHHLDFSSNELCSNTQLKRNLSVIVTSLIKQTLVSGCSVLVTSRPTHLASFETGDFQRITEIMGFSSEDRQKYFDHFFFPNTDLSDKVFKYVQGNDALYTFCYIPSYCWIICTVLSMCFKTQPNSSLPSLPKTITQLFVTYVANMLTNHSVRPDDRPSGAKDLLTSLGRLAEDGLLNKRLVFKKLDIQTFKIDTSSPLLSSFIIESREASKTTYSFLHLTIQEFFTALAQYLHYRPDNMELIIQKASNCEDGYGQMVLPFLCGLSDASTRSTLNHFLRELPTDASKQVIKWLQSLFPVITKRGKDPEDKRKCMTVLSYFFESRNKALVNQCLKSNCTLEFSEYYLTPLHCTVLAFILESCKGAECLDLDSCYIQSEGLQRLAPFLHMVKNLRLSKNDLKDEDVAAINQMLSHPSCKIEKLILRNNALTDASCTTLACAVSSCQSLRLLDVSRNKLAGPGLQDLVTAVSAPSCLIENLMLQQGKLTDEHARLLMPLSENPNLKKLDLSLNFFTDRSSGIIRELIKKSHHMEEIKINTNDFSEQIEQSLSQLKVSK
ncbi:NACHT, LRR and PYD domains-containing protein 12-like isoform X2 [Hyperolius riggenbachi]